MTEILTIREIERRYAPDWVLIGEPEVDPSQRLLTGRVLFHSPDREAVYRKMGELVPGEFAVRYLGDWPTGMDLALGSHPVSSEIPDGEFRLV